MLSLCFTDILEKNYQWTNERHKNQFFIVSQNVICRCAVRVLNQRCQDLGRLGMLIDATTGERFNCTEPYACVAQPLYDHDTPFAAFKIEGEKIYRHRAKCGPFHNVPCFGVIISVPWEYIVHITRLVSLSPLAGVKFWFLTKSPFFWTRIFNFLSLPHQHAIRYIYSITTLKL